jgi:hypothetical protein
MFRIRNLFQNPGQALVVWILGLIIWGFAATTSSASQRVTVDWDFVTNTNVTFHRVLYGTVSGAYTNVPVVFRNFDEVIISGLQEGKTYYFVVQASNENGQNSPLSAEVAYTVPVFQPIALHTQMVTDGNGHPYGMNITATGSVGNTWELDYSPDLLNWYAWSYGYNMAVSEFVTFDQGDQLFFRLQSN